MITTTCSECKILLSVDPADVGLPVAAVFGDRLYCDDCVPSCTYCGFEHCQCGRHANDQETDCVGLVY